MLPLVKSKFGLGVYDTSIEKEIYDDIFVSILRTVSILSPTSSDFSARELDDLEQQRQRILKDTMIKVIRETDNPLIDYCVSKYNDKWYIIAVNTHYMLIKGSFSVNEEKIQAEYVHLPFENRSIVISDNRFDDIFE